MRKNIITAAVISLGLFFAFIPLEPASAGTEIVEYLCEFGKSFYQVGRYDEALTEFKKVLLLDPNNKTAQEYINNIFLKQNPPQVTEAKTESIQNAVPVVSVKAPSERVVPPTNKETRNDAIENAFNSLRPDEGAPKAGGLKIGDINISGQAQVAMGFTSKDAIWKRANFDLNEKFLSWRPISDAAFNRRFNTYDPAIYDSLIVNADTDNKQGFNFHTNVTVDPWSYTGKTNKFTVSSGGDSAEVQMYYWSNTGYTLNRTVYTSLKGDTFSLPELKVYNGETKPVTVTSDFLSNSFSIPAAKVYRQFQPVREIWGDYTNDQIKLRAFPLAYQDQAYSSDDPLNITNHGIWWKDSKWLRMYTPGIYNSGDSPVSFTKGLWDDSLSFLTKDSTGKYLTALRGFSFNFQSNEGTSLDATLATPKHLWQDYGKVDNIISANRLKHYFSDNFMGALTFTSRTGFITEGNEKLDSQNFVTGLDLGYELADGLKAQAEVLTTHSDYDISNSDYKTNAGGNAYYFSFISRYPQDKIMNLRYGYDDIRMNKEENFLLKSKFYASRMDSDFDSSLSDFHNTRQDVFWSRHIHFRKPMSYFAQGLAGSMNDWEELNSTRIGDGIDVGRNTMGFRIEAELKDKFYNLFDVRNVHNVDGGFIENVVRDELTVDVTDKLTAKALGIYHKLPKTTAGVDPFIYDGKTGDFFDNDAIIGGDNPTIKTGSIGLKYDFFDWLSFDGIYERTNDYTLAYGNFPQNILRNDTTLNSVYYQNDYRYLSLGPFLYDQGLFPQAPYEFYNVFKTGLRIMPLDNMEIYLDYTRNEYETASLINDNMNHVGLEFTYMPAKKFGMSLKYVYSRSKDIVQNGSHFALTDDPVSHHNFFSEFRYMPSKEDECILQYGVGDTSSIGNLSSVDPYGGSMLTLDTQHIIRAYYRRKF